MGQILVGLVLLVGCCAVIVRLFQTQRLGRAIVASLLLVGLVVGVPAALLSSAQRTSREGVRDTSAASYVGSESCKKCHVGEYANWENSFHRKMTQNVSDETVLGDFDNVTVAVLGQECRLFREGENFYMEVPDREEERRQWEQGGSGPIAAKTYRVDRLVGSHNMQVYLTRYPNGAHVVLPLVWHVDQRRWIHRGSRFLVPPPETVWDSTGPWNINCIQCHNTKPNPGLDPHSDLTSDPPGQWDAQMAEMGIGCEACHGPGQEHVARNQNPLRRQLLDAPGRDDPSIVHPGKLSQLRSIEVCGRCHGKWLPKQQYLLASLSVPDPHVPGRDPMDWFRYPFATASTEFSEQGAGVSFWPDRTPRTTAMEFQGMLLSPCFQRGEMTCLSCHSMHASEPKDLLAFPENPDTPALESNQACIQCHTDYAPEESLVAHTRHAPYSEGSRCANCHMPYLAFGLLKAVRSHRIDSPDAKLSAEARVPNACNQCHVDRSLQWTSERLRPWYGQEPAGLTGEDANVSAMVVDALKGHALSRALAMSRLGWSAGLEAAPGNWRVPFLTAGLEDPYAPVRFLAVQSLRRLPGFERVEYDYLGDEQRRAQQVAEIRRLWDEARRGLDDAPADSVPIRPDGSTIAEVYERLLQQRDETPIHIIE